DAELQAVSALGREHPRAMLVQWQIHAARKLWAEALALAERMVKRWPKHPGGWIHRSYALHELGHTTEAYALLLPALERFRDEWVIPYNLACYATKLGDLELARRWLAEAAKRGEPAHLRRVALEDEDLKPLWPEIENWPNPPTSQKTSLS
ncbi:MAG: hypothetical protein D6766_01365, partial [Verrucomicrobia bacterium]